MKTKTVRLGFLFATLITLNSQSVLAANHLSSDSFSESGTASDNHGFNLRLPLGMTVLAAIEKGLAGEIAFDIPLSDRFTLGPTLGGGFKSESNTYVLNTGSFVKETTAFLLVGAVSNFMITGSNRESGFFARANLDAVLGRIYRSSADGAYQEGSGATPGVIMRAELGYKFLIQRHFTLGLSAGVLAVLVNPSTYFLSEGEIGPSTSSDGMMVMPIGNIELGWQF